MPGLKHAIAVLLLLPGFAEVGLAEQRQQRNDVVQWHRQHETESWRHHHHPQQRNGWWVSSAIPPVTFVQAYSPPPQYRYYCAKPVGYYPYVAQCNGFWQLIPVTMPVPAR